MRLTTTPSKRGSIVKLRRCRRFDQNASSTNRTPPTPLHMVCFTISGKLEALGLGPGRNGWGEGPSLSIRRAVHCARPHLAPQPATLHTPSLQIAGRSLATRNLQLGSLCPCNLQLATLQFDPSLHTNLPRALCIGSLPVGGIGLKPAKSIG